MSLKTYLQLTFTPEGKNIYSEFKRMSLALSTQYAEITSRKNAFNEARVFPKATGLNFWDQGKGNKAIALFSPTLASENPRLYTNFVLPSIFKSYSTEWNNRVGL